MAGKLEFVLKMPAVRVINRKESEQYLPHRDPFLLLDETYILEDEKYISGSRLFTGEEDFFKGHFPTHPVVPGVLILEIMSQIGATAIMQQERFKGKVGFLMSIDYAKFRGQVEPGDKLKVAIEVLRVGKVTKLYSEAYTNKGLCSEAQLNFILGEK